MKKVLSIAVVLGALAAAPVYAAPLELQLTAEFSGAVGGANVVYTPGGLAGTTSASWGDPLPTSRRSSYTFASEFPVEYGDVETDTTFLLGTFSHNNQTISSGTGIDEITLNFAFEFFGATPNPLNTLSVVVHDETPNNAALCPGDATPCSDVVTFGPLASELNFTIGTKAYTINILGFSTDGGVTFSDEFVTLEGLNNQAGLYAEITEAEVPEPATLLLLGSALALGGMRLRRRS